MNAIQRQYLKEMGVDVWLDRNANPVNVIVKEKQSPNVQPVSTVVPVALSQELEVLKQQVAVCQNCSLHESRTQTVFGVGNPDADWLVIGEAPGADTMALRWAKDSGIPVERYPAQWDKYGKSAGPIRNKQMLDEGKPDLVIAFHANISASRGTKNMISQAQAAGIQVILEPLDAYKA